MKRRHPNAIEPLCLLGFHFPRSSFANCEFALENDVRADMTQWPRAKPPMKTTIPARMELNRFKGTHGAHTDEIGERPLDAQIGESLVQALEDCVTLLLRFVWHDSLLRSQLGGGWEERSTPQSQLTTFTASTVIPVFGGNPGQRVFGSGFAVREALATGHDRHPTCNLCNGAGEKALDGSKAGVERQTRASAATGTRKIRARTTVVGRPHFE